MRTVCQLALSWIVVSVLTSWSLYAQDAVVVAGAEIPANVPPEVRAKMMEARARARAGGAPTPGQAKPDGEKPPAKKDEGEGKKDEDKKAAESTGITRPKANEPANPTELKVKPDAQGNVVLQLRGQKWIDVLQMVADWTDLSFDWTELPDDAVNLTTTRAYSVDEARDTFNRMLLDRGYTMLIRPELNSLFVHKIDKLNPALLPRVSPEELDEMSPYQLAKVSFPLGQWLKAEDAAKDFESMKSPNGKIQPLKATNRLEVIDAVINLRQMRNVLADEVTASGQKQRVRVFYLRFRGATEVEEMLRGLLGLESKSAKPQAPMTPQQMQRQMQMMQQQQQKNKGAVPAPKKTAARLVVNKRLNSILVYAEPVEMAIVDQAIQTIDVPSAGDTSLPSRMMRWRSYKLASMDPEPLVRILKDVGNLDYNSVIEVDTKNKAIVAYASLADHVAIQSLVDKLDASGRDFKVIKLRRLKADYVAGTIQFMMGEEEKEDTSRRSWYYYGRRNEEEDKNNKFRVDADVENNWLLLRANPTELKEVENLLVQLGEIRVPGANPSTIRYIDSAPGEDTEQLLERIRRMWPSLAPNALEIEPAPEEKEEDVSRGPRQRISPAETTTTRWSPDNDHDTVRQSVLNQERASLSSFRWVQQTPSRASDDDTFAERAVATDDEQQDELLERFREFEKRQQRFAEAADEVTPAEPPPVRVSRGRDGRLILSSEDTRALDIIEDLLAEQAPRPKSYKIFKLKYADSLDVKYVLEDYFKEDEDGNNSRYPFFFYFDDFGSNDKKSRRLSDRRPLKFIRDMATNSIVVQNADPAQLATIEELINFYDQPESPDSQLVRKMKFIHLQYADAEKVVDRVKEVFIDLLTPNDKARQQNQKGEQRVDRVYNYNYSSDNTVKKVPKFKGDLHLTADAASNNVVVLAPMYILEHVEAMVRYLDDAAKPSSSVQVIKLDGAINSAQVKSTLSKMLGDKVVQSKKEGEGQEGKDGKPQGPQNGQKNGRSVTPGG